MFVNGKMAWMAYSEEIMIKALCKEEDVVNNKDRPERIAQVRRNNNM